MASQKRYQGNSEGLKVLKKAVKYIIFVVFVKKSGRSEEILMKSSERKSLKKHVKYCSFVKVGSAKGVKHIGF